MSSVKVFSLCVRHELWFFPPRHLLPEERWCLLSLGTTYISSGEQSPVQEETKRKCMRRFKNVDYSSSDELFQHDGTTLDNDGSTHGYDVVASDLTFKG